ncbi:MAG: hypothetical protein OEV80_15095, partial [candidate division Zixibacteria bacterium]|nr:hypothetical protein [candidate division Zixibacteria bacterium]
TEAARRPFWSPDSRYLAFSVGRNQLKKVPINGGPAQLVGEFERVADGSWGSDGIIIFDGSDRDSLHTVAAGGGSAVVVSQLDQARSERYHAWPDFLPDGKHFLFLVASDSTLGSSTFDLKLGRVDSDETVDLFKTTSRVVYCEPGYLVYVKDKILLAQAFDVSGLKVVGEPIPVAENIASLSQSAVSSFDVSDEGTLVYMTSDASIKNELVWVDRTGKELAKIGEPGRYGDVALATDGQRLVFGLEDPQTETIDLWMHDIKRGVSSRFTFEEGEEFAPLWSQDGSTVYYNHGSIPAILPFWKPANGTGEASLLLDSAAGPFNVLTDISRDGNRYCFTGASEGQPDIKMMNLATDSIPVPLIKTPLDEYGGIFSPDGTYLLYAAEETDITELYLLKLDGAGGKWQISTSGVRSAVWNPAGGEILYFNREWEMMSVPIKTDGSVEIGSPTKLFQHRLSTLKFGFRPFDVSADGQRFLLVSAMDQKVSPKFNVVLNWPSLIEEDR